MNFLQHLLDGELSWGWERWPGKPRLAFYRTWHDGWHYVLHLGPLWINGHY